MSILAIDTATQVSSVAVASREKLSAELTVQASLMHSETLMPHVEQVLRMAGCRKEELEGIAVSIGPGSFTGLRIGLAAAKAMGYALSVPVVGVSTLEALACHYPVPNVCVVCMLDAQKGNAYVGQYHWENGVLVEAAPVVVQSLSEAIQSCAMAGEPVVLLGDVMQKKRDRLTLPANVAIAPAHLVMPRAACVAMRGLSRLAAGESDPIMTLEPCYIRRSEAEVLWEKRYAEAGK